MRRFSSRPSAVRLSAIGSASARPSTVKRPASPVAAAMIADAASARAGREVEVGREAHGADRLVVGMADHLHAARLGAQPLADALQASG